VSQKGRLRRLDAGVRWLETEGTYLRVAGLVKYLEMLLDIADRAAVDPVFAAEWERDFPYIVLPPPRRTAAPPRPKPEPAPPPESTRVIVPETPPEPAPPVLPILRDAALQAATQDEVARESAPPAPMPGMPVSPPSPDMEIRPVQWRQRGPQDDYEEEGDTYGRCITEYDVLRDEYDDEG